MPGGNGRFLFAPAPVTAARFVREAEEVRKPAGARIDVDGADEHVTALVEDLLRAVAVVRVDVEDRDRAAETVCSAAAATAELLR